MGEREGRKAVVALTHTLSITHTRRWLACLLALLGWMDARTHARNISESRALAFSHSKLFTFSVTRLVCFKMILITKFLTKVAQIFGDVLDCLEKYSP